MDFVRRLGEKELCAEGRSVCHGFWRMGFAVAALAMSVSTSRASLGFRSSEFDEEDNEEPAGSSFQVQLNPVDEVYGFSAGYGVWIRETPLFGDYFTGLFRNGIEDALYADLGMTVRIMPHWKLAPFVGGGASYNLSLSNQTKDEPLNLVVEPGALPQRGESYWGMHAEGGLRMWIDNRLRMLELMGRYTWSSLEGPHDYWLVGVSFGVGL